MIEALIQINIFLIIAILLGVTIGYLFALAKCSEKSDEEKEVLNENLHVDELTGIVSDNSQLNKHR